MKQLKYLSFALLIALCTGFVSCSDDDDEEPAAPATSIIGTWEPVSDYSCEKINGQVAEEHSSLESLVILAFTEDGKCYWYDPDTRVLKKECSYNYADGKLTVSAEDGRSESTASFPSSSELVLESSASAEYNGYLIEIYAKSTYRKIEDFWK